MMATVPYYVMELHDGRSRAVFSVPEAVATSLTAHPVLCRGAAFDLTPDWDAASLLATAKCSGLTPPGRTSFVYTEFYSPAPEETAVEISKRLAVRVREGKAALSTMGSFLRL